MCLQVTVGVLHQKRSKLLIQQRRAGTDCAGQWEFPGGKVEVGETPQTALIRELKEELNINVISMQPLIEHAQDYKHAKVELHTFMVEAWQGEPSGFEGQIIRWVALEQILEYDLLQGAYPLLAAAKLFLAKREF